MSGSSLPPVRLHYDGDTAGAGNISRVLPPQPLPALPPAPAAPPTITPMAPLLLRPDEHAQFLTYDLDGDLRADRVVVLTGPAWIKLQPFLTQMDGTAVAGQQQLINLPQPATGYRIVTADFDGDGTGDIAVVGLGAHLPIGMDVVTAAIARFNGTTFTIGYDPDGFGVVINLAHERQCRGAGHRG